MSSNGALAIFFRRINDLQQSIPIVKNIPKNKVILICLDIDFDFTKSDIIQRYLKDNIRIYHLHNLLIKRRTLLNFIIKFFILINKKKFYYKFIGKIFYKKNIKFLISKFNIKRVIFDYPITNQNYINFISKIKDLNLKIFGIHHAVWVRSTNVRNLKFKKIFLQNSKNINLYHKIFTFNPDYKRALEYLSYKNKFLFIGSLRYDKNYIKKKEYKLNNKSRTVNLVYLDHSYKHGVKKEEVMDTLIYLSKLSEVNLFIKINTASLFKDNNKNLKLFSENGLEKFISNENTSDLINKCQIIISPISSAAIEAIYLKKILIHPPYLVDNDVLLWQRFKCCFEPSDKFALKKIILNYINKKLNTKKYYQNSKNLINFLDTKKKLKTKISLFKNIIFKKSKYSLIW
jgi:hypothetical protein